MKTLITEIQRFSVHDGPGIRSTVFLKGCPLRCAWCHNPECISYEAEELFYPERCIGCGGCADGCFSGARVLCGREMSVSEVMEEVLRDRAYYGSVGGVTVSGGEPLAHPDFVRELLAACRNEGIGTAVETSLYRFDPDILSRVDLIMADLKVFDSAKHREYTGIGNEEIKRNLLLADSLGVPLLIRTPIVPTVNDSVENISDTADFLRGLRHVIRYELLPYHPLGLSKARALGREMRKFSIPTKSQMEMLNQYADLSRQT